MIVCNLSSKDIDLGQGRYHENTVSLGKVCGVISWTLEVESLVLISKNFENELYFQKQ